MNLQDATGRGDSAMRSRSFSPAAETNVMFTAYIEGVIERERKVLADAVPRLTDHPWTQELIRHPCVSTYAAVVYSPTEYIYILGTSR